MMEILKEKWIKTSLIFIIIVILILIILNFLPNREIDFCGDNICSETETCSLCVNDCGCGSGELCSNDQCIFGYETITNFTTCFNEFTVSFTSQDFQNSLDIIPKCRLLALEEIGNIQTLLLTADDEEKEFLEIQELKYKSDESYLNYKYNAINQLYLKYSDDQNVNYLELIEDLKSPFLLSSLESSLYNHYQIKTKYPNYYDEHTEELFQSTISEYEKNSQFLNKIYDSFKDYNYKYFLQIDPLNPTVDEISNELTNNLLGNEQEIKESLIKFVRNNVKYQFNPNWQTNWVSPPTLTLIRGTGECTDMSVLLASLFINGGIEDVNLCFVDTNGYGIDHLAVGVKIAEEDFELWDPTCNSCEGSAPKTSKFWKVDCFDVQEYLKKPLQRCPDQTPFNECSSLIGYYCEEGQLIAKCEECGCSNESICYNSRCYKCEEGVTFIEGQCIK